MFSENFENAPNNVEPPNDDVFHVKDELKLILKYFKDCNTISSVVPDIDEHINKIREQGKEFNACLQRSITQSNNFENHANNALDYLEILNDPNFDENHVSDILQILTENAENNKNETREIKEKYESVYNKLQEIYTENYEGRCNDRRELQKFIDRRDDLEEDLKGLKLYNIAFFFIGFISLILLLILEGFESKYMKSFELSTPIKISLGIGIVMMVILRAGNYLYKIKLEFDIQKNEREVNKSQRMVDLRNNISELREINNNLNPIMIQMDAFSKYWDSQLNILGDLSNNLGKITNININNQAIKLFTKPMKPNWQRAKTLCGNYIRTVRKTIKDVNNS